MENDHQARIERLELMYKESHEQMLRRNDELQAQVLELTKLIAASLKEKGQVSAVDNGRGPSNPGKDVNNGTEAINVHERVFHEPQVPIAPAPATQPFIYINPTSAPSLVHGYQAPGSSPARPLVPDLDEQAEQERAKSQSSPENVEESDKYQLLEKRLRVVEGNDKFGIIDAKSLGLVSNLVIPPKFKTPEFEKYNGTTDPSAHLRMYCRRMAGYEENEKLLIHCFQDSLMGPAARWYIELDRIRIQTWADLARAFLDQYKHVSDWIPDRLSLMNMEKKSTESFRQYAQRWREEAAQVQPPLTEKEMTVIFIETLKAPFYEKLVGNATKNFADMVISGEMIDKAIKSGKISAGESSGLAKKYNPKGKEKEVNAVSENTTKTAFSAQKAYFSRATYPSFNQYSPMPVSQPVYSTGCNPTMTFPSTPVATVPQNGQSYNTNNNRAPNNQQVPREREHFDPLPYPYKEIYARLLAGQLVAPIFINPRSPPYPKWYDENAYCEYHAGAQGHSIENCTSFKRKVQGLINRGIIKVEQSPGPNVAANPLPNHAEPRVNAIMDSKVGCVKQNIQEVKIPMVRVWQALTKAGVISKSTYQNEQCAEHSCRYCGHEHPLQCCSRFRATVQKMMDQSLIEFYDESAENHSLTVNVIDEDRKGPPYGVGKPLILFANQPEISATPTQPTPKIIFQFPSSFPYKDNKAVPWSYESRTIVTGEGSQHTANVDLTGVSHLTRSGRCYAPVTPENQGQSEEFVPKAQAPQAEKANVKESVNEKEATEFLKFIKHSEYNIVDQLNKQPAKISVLSLLLNSEAHRNALLKVLNEAYVPPNIPIGQLDRLISNITADNYISFSDDEIPLGGRGNYKALHITTSCKGTTLPKVLIDNGSALNVMPVACLNKLPIDTSHLKQGRTMVRAFDGTCRDVMGSITIPLQIGPCIYEVDFHVMDIMPSYNCLLGRPWIHSAGAVPSSLHQKLKFVIENKVVTIGGEEDIIAATSTDAPYIEPDEDVPESSFQSFEFVNATYVKEGTPMVKPHLSRSTHMGLKMTIGKGAQAGKGLGKHLQGIVRALKVVNKANKKGLGFKNSSQQQKKQSQKGKEGKVACLLSQELGLGTTKLPRLKDSFRPGGYRDQMHEKRSKGILVLNTTFGSLSINAIEEPEISESDREINLCPPGFVPSVWTETEIPVLFGPNSK